MDTGNTYHVDVINFSESVHPRGYGEHPFGMMMNCRSFGSSPWTRGTHDSLALKSQRSRFIPVDTGNTFLIALLHDNNAVHPRGYGEHQTTLDSNIITRGSSPWIRGTLNTSQDYFVQLRFIPVDTGNTAFALPHPVIRPVHPRGYGEH